MDISNAFFSCRVTINKVFMANRTENNLIEPTRIVVPERPGFGSQIMYLFFLFIPFEGSSATGILEVQKKMMTPMSFIFIFWNSVYAQNKIQLMASSIWISEHRPQRGQVRTR